MLDDPDERYAVDLYVSLTDGDTSDESYTKARDAYHRHPNHTQILSLHSVKQKISDITGLLLSYTTCVRTSAMHTQVHSPSSITAKSAVNHDETILNTLDSNSIPIHLGRRCRHAIARPRQRRRCTILRGRWSSSWRRFMCREGSASSTIFATVLMSGRNTRVARLRQTVHLPSFQWMEHSCTRIRSQIVGSISGSL